MSIVLAAVILFVVTWSLLSLVLVELPSLKIITAMKKIHGPKGLPFFLGEALRFVKMESTDIFNYLKEIIYRYPRITGFYLAGVPMIILQKPQDIQPILGSNQNIKKGFEYTTISPWLNEGLLTSYGSKWQSRRKMLTPTFHFKILDDAFSIMTKNSEVLTDKFLSRNGEKICMYNFVSRCAVDIIAETAMGVQLKSQTEGPNSYLKQVKRVSELILMRVLKVYHLHNYIYYWSSNGKSFRKHLSSLHKFTDKIIAERKDASSYENKPEEDNYGRKKKLAFLDCLLSMQKENPKAFSDKDIREEVDTFMFEGHDTTSAAISFCIWLLGSHPEVQDKLYKEVMEFIGDDEITIANINRMNYLDRVIKESLRLYPSVPYISRRIVEDVHLDGGIVLPTGSNVIIIPYLLHRDPETFPDPERFDPDRFIVESSIGRHPYAYIPFSAGPRNCVGQKFALLEMKVAIATVLRKCRIESITKLEDFEILPTLIIQPSCPIECVFFPRKT